MVEVLVKAGFSIRRQSGSHIILYKDGLMRPLSVPVHAEDIPQGTLRALIRQSGLTIEEFIALI